MTKITETRTYDASRDLATEAGKSLKGFIESTNRSFELILRSLKNGLSFNDNFNGEIRVVSLTSGKAQQIGVTKKPAMIFPVQVMSEKHYLDKPLHWYFNNRGEVMILGHFADTPSIAIEVRLVILFS